MRLPEVQEDGLVIKNRRALQKLVKREPVENNMDLEKDYVSSSSSAFNSAAVPDPHSESMPINSNSTRAKKRARNPNTDNDGIDVIMEKVVDIDPVSKLPIQIPMKNKVNKIF